MVGRDLQSIYCRIRHHRCQPGGLGGGRLNKTAYVSRRIVAYPRSPACFLAFLAPHLFFIFFTLPVTPPALTLEIRQLGVTRYSDFCCF